MQRMPNLVANNRKTGSNRNSPPQVNVISHRRRVMKVLTVTSIISLGLVVGCGGGGGGDGAQVVVLRQRLHRL